MSLPVLLRTLFFFTRAGMMELSCPLGTTCRVLREFFGQYQWLDIVLGFFFPVSLWTSTPSRFINTQKKKEPAILITRLVNNLHLFMEVAKSLMSQKKVKRTSKLCQN